MIKQMVVICTVISVIGWNTENVLFSGKHQGIKNKVSIDDRPDIINHKERFGDWEIDLIVGKNNKGAMVTIVERTIAMLMIRKLKKGKSAQSLADTFIDMLMRHSAKAEQNPYIC